MNNSKRIGWAFQGLVIILLIIIHIDLRAQPERIADRVQYKIPSTFGIENELKDINKTLSYIEDGIAKLPREIGNADSSETNDILNKILETLKEVEHNTDLNGDWLYSIKSSAQLIESHTDPINK